MEIVIVNAYGRTNRGDSVLLDECISDVRIKYPGAKLSVVLFDSSGFIDAHSNIDVLERICNPIQKSNGTYSKLYKYYAFFCLLITCFLKIKFFLYFLSHKQRKTAEKIINADMVISAPGGYLHDTNLAYYIALLHIKLPTVFGLKTILAPQSYGPIKSHLGKFFFKKVLNAVGTICYREKYSGEFLIESGIYKDKIVHTGDSAFWNEQVIHDKIYEIFNSYGIGAEEKFLGITCVDWTFPGQKNQIGLKEMYIQVLTKVILSINRKYGFRTVIFNQVKDDLSVSAIVAGNTKDISVLIREDYEPEILRSLIAKSCVFLGTRFHSCIFALMAHVPTTAISYLPKTSYILRDLHITDRDFDINNLELDAIIESLENDIENRVAVSNSIALKIEVYKRSMMRLQDVI